MLKVGDRVKFTEDYLRRLGVPGEVPTRYAEEVKKGGRIRRIRCEYHGETKAVCCDKCYVFWHATETWNQYPDKFIKVNSGPYLSNQGSKINV